MWGNLARLRRIITPDCTIAERRALLPLGNPRRTLTPPPLGVLIRPVTPANVKARADRDLRLRLRAGAQYLTCSKAVAKCGRALAGRDAAGDYGTVSLRVSWPIGHEPRAYFAGLYRCSSVWECPVCAPRVQRGRAAEAQELNARHDASGGGMYLVTLTVPHDVGDRLKPMRKHVSRTWSRILNGDPWKRWRDRLGFVGYVRALEATHGPNGWHPHVHVALYTVAPVPARELVRFRTWLRNRWRDKVTRRTPEGIVYRAPDRRHGVKISALRQSSYLTKMGLASWELTSSSTKAGRHGHRTPFQVLRDLVCGDDPERRRRDAGVWAEWAAGIKGARQLVYSPGLRRRYRLGEELPDDRLPDCQADLELTGAGDGDLTLWTFSREEWANVVRSRHSVSIRCRLLAVVELQRDLWDDEVVRILDRAAGLPAVPF